jgi:tryptophan synthase beta chain
MNAATIGHGSPGVLHGSFSYLLQDEDGQVQETHSVSAGLDYPGVGPEHSWLADSGRATYEEASDDEALSALDELGRHEGILPALESSHALAAARRFLSRQPGATLLIGLSGRGDKDIDILRGLER